MKNLLILILIPVLFLISCRREKISPELVMNEFLNLPSGSFQVDEAKLLVDESIKIDEKAIKAMFLRSVAHLKTQNYEDAATDCKAAIILNPKEKSYRDHWELIKTEKASKS